MRTGAIAIVVLLSAQASALALCGTRGGPGYRGPNGQCVSWVGIGRICGYPPTTRCTPEEPNPGADRAAKLGVEIQKLRGHAGTSSQ